MRKDKTRISILLLLAFCLGACGSGEVPSPHVPTQVPTYTPDRHSSISLVAAEGPPYATPLAPDAAGPAIGELDASRKGVYAVDLIAAWVEAGSSESSLFDFSGNDGNIYQAIFDVDVLPLFTQGDVWFQAAPSCASCHHANLATSYQEMDLTSHEGIMAGGDRLSAPPGMPLLGQSEIGTSDYDWSSALLRKRLRNNRMPPGVPFDITEASRDGPTVQVGEMAFTAVELIEAWVKEEMFVDAQATFEEHVLPLFTEAGVWYADAPSCTSCHHADLETSHNGMDLSSYVGVMAGTRRLSNPSGVPLLGQSEVGASDYDWSGSLLRERLRNNRMPPGMPFDITEVNRDGPLVRVAE